MNLANKPTIQQLEALLRACDDSKDHHITWVDRTGDVHVETHTAYRARNAGKPPEEALWWSEIVIQGNGYVGPAAAADPAYMQSEFDDLTTRWKSGFRGFADF